MSRPPARRAVNSQGVVESLPERLLASGRFRCVETRGGELVVTWELDDGGSGAELRLPVPLYALVQAAARGERVSFGAVARAMRAGG